MAGHDRVRGPVAVAVLRVRRPAGGATASARFTSCNEVLDAAWTVLTATDKEQVLRQVAAWLDTVWEEPDGS